MPPARLTYKDIAADLDARIRSGEYPAGVMLPSYRAIAEIYSVSVTTAQSALRILRERGLIRGQLGVGNFVVYPPEVAT
jgi:DNA-binding GntR family transcriptional regulator